MEFIEIFGAVEISIFFYFQYIYFKQFKTFYNTILLLRAIFFSVSKHELRNSLYLGCLSMESAYIEVEYETNVLMENIEAMKHLFGESHGGYAYFFSCV